MANPVSVKWFTSAMSGAPALSGEAGKLIALLDACLINGFGSVTLASLVVASGVATGTVNTGHGFLDHAVVLIEGATPSELNGAKRITHTGTNTFTFDATGVSNQTATGTITAKMAPLGWAKTYSGTNKAAYSRTALGATAMLLRVDDTPTRYPAVRMYETMSDVDTGTGASTTQYTGKSSAASSTARDWALFGDDFLFYLVIKADGSKWYSGLCFGDIVPYLSTDAYHCQLTGNTAQDYYYCGFFYPTTAYGEFSRSYSQSGGAVGNRRYSHQIAPTVWGNAGVTYPCPTLSGLLAWPVEAWESTTIPRGLMPGFYNPLVNSYSPPTNGTTFNAVPGFTGRLFYFQSITNTVDGGVLIDLTGPWRT